VEWLAALPVLLLLGLGVIQFALVYQARHALDYALWQAARAGSVAHADRDAIVAGLATGMTPWLSGADNAVGLLVAEAASIAHVEAGLTEGWLQLQQRSPLAESFTDWSVPALDPLGEPIAGMIEIPNDNLDSRRVRMEPASGVAGLRGDEPVGAASEQTLADANLLRLEMVYGVRLVVPIVGRLLVATLSAWDGCSADVARRLGTVRLEPVAVRADAAAAHCAFYAAADAGSAGRIPLRLSATVRMMSTARQSALTPGRRHGPSLHASLGPGRLDAAAGPSVGPGADGPGAAGGSGQAGRGGSGQQEAGPGGGQGGGPGGGRLVIPGLIDPPPAVSQPGAAPGAPGTAVPHPGTCR
jgi:hypothetical protein